jgi:hypothetical protein
MIGERLVALLWVCLALWVAMILGGCKPRIALEVTPPDPELMAWRVLITKASNDHETRLQALEKEVHDGRPDSAPR